jgi:hypothetical protein
MDRQFDPRRLPDGGRTLSLAVELCAALALLDGDEPQAWQRCRGAALRYVEAVRAGGFGAPVALDLLQRAVHTWVPSALDPERRARLDARVPFWVGTVYGLRWDADAAGAPADPDRSHSPAPAPGYWEQMQGWRAALQSRRRELRMRREALGAAAAEREARALALCDTSAERLGESHRIAEEMRARQATQRLAPVARRLALPVPATVRLSNQAILDIARRIRRAVREPRPDDPRNDVLAIRHELSPEDEARVEAALRELSENENE